MKHEAYIDRDNLVSFVVNSKEDILRYTYCINMLKTHFPIKLNVTYEECEKDPILLNCVKEFMSGMNQCVPQLCKSQDEIFPPRPFQDIQGLTKEQLMSIYMIDDKDTSDLVDKGNILIVPMGEELDYLSTLYMDDYQFTKIENIYRLMSKSEGNWNALGKYSSPCTEILFVDRFILSKPILYKNNLYAIIDELSKPLRNTSVNIVIVCEDKYTLKNNVKTPKWQEIRDNIKSILNPWVNAKVSFVAVTEKEKGQYPIHDRSIITNYKIFESGATFNYYNSKGEITTHGDNLTVYSLAHCNNLEVLSEKINKIQLVVDKIHKDKSYGQLYLDDKGSHSIFLNIQK